MHATIDHPKIGGEILRLFEESVREGGLKLALFLSSNMAIPRCTVYDIIAIVQKFVVVTITQGIENVITPLAGDASVKDYMEAFTQICNSIFSCVETEHIFDATLKAADLISPLKKFEIGTVVDGNCPQALEDRFVISKSIKLAKLEDCLNFIIQLHVRT